MISRSIYRPKRWFEDARHRYLPGSRCGSPVHTGRPSGGRAVIGCPIAPRVGVLDVRVLDQRRLRIRVGRVLGHRRDRQKPKHSSIVASGRFGRMVDRLFMRETPSGWMVRTLRLYERFALVAEHRDSGGSMMSQSRSNRQSVPIQGDTRVRNDHHRRFSNPHRKGLHGRDARPG